MNKKVNLCDIEALREGTNDKYGVSATLVFNKGLTYKELEQVINKKYFYLSNNNLQEENKKLKEQLEYLRSNEYLNQVKWERNFNEDLVKKLQKELDKAINKKETLKGGLDDIYRKYYFDLKERIDKAIEYIGNHKLDFKQGTTTFGSERLTMEERKLIDILRGEDNE